MPGKILEGNSTSFTSLLRLGQYLRNSWGIVVHVLPQPNNLFKMDRSIVLGRVSISVIFIEHLLSSHLP
jgi:hypothetical protein